MISRPKFLVLCILLFALGRQVSGRPNGDRCRKDSQCDSGNCCGVWPFKRCRECCKDSDCPSGSNCKDRKCIAPRANGMSCVPDSDCASGHCCGVVPLKRCRECCKDSHCPSGQNCKNRRCIAPRPNGRSCTPDSDCESGHCCGVWPFKRCRECCTDSHCTDMEEKFCLARRCRDCLEENVYGCTSDAQCCGQLTCCGDKKVIGIRVSKGTCQDPNLPCCALPGQTCSTFPVAPETLKCCSGTCHEDIFRKICL